MTDSASDFKTLRIKATRKFAQTMIVVDDEASQRKPETPHSPPDKTLVVPDRKMRLSTGAAEPPTEQGQDSSQCLLDAKLLIENAMELGLICSVLRPRKHDDLSGRVVIAAQVADIVCLDWEIHNDSGDTASKIISAIVQKDAKQNGRLRLIAIYTGAKTEVSSILDKILGEIPEQLINKFDKEQLEIKSKNGVKIVCLFKTHGIGLLAPMNANQVSEDQLPERLRTEFAKLSEGLLSNVALETIASIRTSTHHVLSKFTGEMDGPFFHHRALIESPDDAEQYAVDIVLDELRGAIDKHQVAATCAGPQAIKSRIREIAKDTLNLTLNYKKGGNLCTYELETDHVIKIITDGLKSTLEENKPPNSPENKHFEENLSTFFSDSTVTAHKLMHQFAALTCVRAYPGSHLYGSGQLVPKLGLGTVIQDKDNTYLMCLQASCDSVRIKGERSFLFVPLNKEDTKPEHVVPVSSGPNKFDFIGLSTSSGSYCKARPIVFPSCLDAETVKAEKMEGSNFNFNDTERNSYRWIADLRHKRALRTVQRLGQNMGRLGFDEFEPYRRKESQF